MNAFGLLHSPLVKKIAWRVCSTILKVVGIVCVVILCENLGLTNSSGLLSSGTTKDGPTCISSLIATYHSGPCQNWLQELGSDLLSISERSKTAEDSAMFLNTWAKTVEAKLEQQPCESPTPDDLDVQETFTPYGRKGLTKFAWSF